MAEQRLAIIEGMQKSVEGLKEASIDPNEAMQFILITQYMDAMRDIGAGSKSNAVFMSASPGAVGDLREQIMAATLGVDRRGRLV